MSFLSVLHSMVFCKCPRCHEGDLYKKSYFSSAFDVLKGEYHMYDNCPKCGQKYEIEVGFWWGAMYVAYTFSAGALLIVGLLSMLVFEFNEWQILTVLVVTALIGFTWNAKLARSVWVNYFVDYDPNALKEKK